MFNGVKLTKTHPTMPFLDFCTGSQSCGNRIRTLPKLFSKLVLTWCIVLYVYALLIYATYNSTAVLLGQDTLVEEIKSQEFIFSWLNRGVFLKIAPEFTGSVLYATQFDAWHCTWCKACRLLMQAAWKPMPRSTQSDGSLTVSHSTWWPCFVYCKWSTTLWFSCCGS